MKLSNGERLLLWPIVGQIIVTAGWKYTDSSAHSATDIKCDVGTPIYPCEPGKVTRVQKWDGKTKTGMQSYGNFIDVAHELYKGKTLVTRYAHLNTILVDVGDYVGYNTIIAYSGNTGNSTGPHLHLEVRLSNVRRNPLRWLNSNFSPKSDAVRSQLWTDHKRNDSGSVAYLYQTAEIDNVTNMQALAFMRTMSDYKSSYTDDTATAQNVSFTLTKADDILSVRNIMGTTYRKGSY